MSDLKSLCEDLGFKNVQTYIQSGNLIFDSDDPILRLQKMLEDAVRYKFGFDVSVIVRSSENLRISIDKNPFFTSNANIDKLHFTFLQSIPRKENIEITRTYNFEPDKFEIIDDNVFVYCDKNYHESKVTNNFFEKKLGVIATTRNWKTILKLVELSRK